MRPISYNLAPLGYGKPCPYIDFTRTCSPWKPQWAGTCVVGPDGWPGSAGEFSSLLPLPPGTRNYTLIPIDGKIDNVRVISTGKRSPADSISGRVTFDATGNRTGKGAQVNVVTKGPATFAIVETSELDRFVAGERWRQQFLDVVTGAPGIRFMDWADVNDTALTTWTPITAATYNGALAPIEDIANLCNKIGADCWLPIPPTMSMDEAKRVYTQLRSLLLPWLNIDAEWANEVWNDKFKIGATAAAFTNGDAVFYGQKSAALSKAIAGIPGVSLVLAWQYTSSPQGKQKVIDSFKAAGGSVAGVSFAIAPYAWNDKETVGTYLANKDQAALLADFAQNQKHYSYKMAETVALAKRNYIDEVKFYEFGVQPGSRGADQLAFGSAACQTEEAGAIVRQIFADADAAGIGDRYAYVAAGQAPFGFWPDYDGSAPYPMGQQLAAYNVKAWPMARADLRLQLDTLVATAKAA